MAVEASHREMIHHGDEIRYGDRFQTEILHMYGSGVTDSFPATVFMAESGLTLTSNRRDSLISFNPPFVNPNHLQFSSFEFLTEDIGSQIYQQQSEIDRFIAHHTEKVRTEIGEIRRRNSMRLAAAYERIMNRLRTKEDEIIKIGELNRSLEQKVKSMSLENQIWRELAQTNEATANALRNNLQQVEGHLQQQQHRLDLADDAQSHCGSNLEEGHRGGLNRRWCRSCRNEESNMLLLPCRHLCVCSLCVSDIIVCPVCSSAKSAGVQVNMS